MLANQDTQAVIDALRPVMTEAGFQRRECTWFRFAGETIQIFDLQPAASRSSQRVYFNLGVTFRELHPPTHFCVFDCPVYGRIDRLVPEGEQLSIVTDFAHSDLSNDKRLNRIVDLIRRFAMPILDSWQSRAGVSEFIQSEQSRGFTTKVL